MPNQSLDRRVRRTKRRLKEALLELIEERDYDRITIKQITRRADVGRSTFYSHYADKADLLFSGFDRWLLSLTDDLPGPRAGEDPRADPPARFRFSLPLLRHIETQKRFFRATIAGGSNPRVRRKTTSLLAEVVGRELDRMSGSGTHTTGGKETDIDSERLRQAQAHGIVGAFLGLASWWLDCGQTLSAEALDELFQDLVVLRGPGL